MNDIETMNITFFVKIYIIHQLCTDKRQFINVNLPGITFYAIHKFR
jgi:hypothetical protein